MSGGAQVDIEVWSARDALVMKALKLLVLDTLRQHRQDLRMRLRVEKRSQV